MGNVRTCLSLALLGGLLAVPGLAAAGFYSAGTAAVELRRIAGLDVPDVGRSLDECALYLYEALDLQEIRLASVATDHRQGSRGSERPALSADGERVVFETEAPEITGIEGPTPVTHVGLRDEVMHTTALVSVNGSDPGAAANSESEEATLSADGTRVAFASEATNLLAPGRVRKAAAEPPASHVYLRDLEAGSAVRVDVANDGTPGNLDGGFAVISADGDHVAFISLATNLVPDDTNGGGDPMLGADIFVRHVALGTTERASLTHEGAEAGGPHGFFSFDVPDSECAPDEPPCQDFFPGLALNADGSVVAFSSVSPVLVPGDTNQMPGEPTTGSDVFVRDLVAGTTERVSVASDGAQGNGESFGAAISADGRYVAFLSFATNLVEGDTNAGVVPPDRTGDTVLADFAGLDVFVRDRVAGTTERVSVADDTLEANGPSGLFLERVPDSDCRGDQTPPCHRDRLGFGISADGRFVVFVSAADALVAGDTNGQADIYVRDRVGGGTARISVNAAGDGANKASTEAAISGDGGTVAFASFATNLVAGDDNSYRPMSFFEPDVFVAPNPFVDLP